MPEMIETITSGKTTTRWWAGMINIQSVVILCSGVVAIVAFVLKVNADNAEIKELKTLIATKASAEAMKDLEEKVNRQYSVQRDQNEKEGIEIEEALDWQHEWDGYWKGLKEK